MNFYEHSLILKQMQAEIEMSSRHAWKWSKAQTTISKKQSCCEVTISETPACCPAY